VGRILYTIDRMQNLTATISKRPLRDDAYALLRDRIVGGAAPPGSRLQDSLLAAELGVSRTPIREALLRLEKEGLAESDPHRGFFVAPLTREKAAQVYPVVWALECLALETSPLLTPRQAEELRRTNEELAAASDDPARCHELDTRWHQTLVGACGNPLLLDLLAGLRHQVRRYECAVYMRDPALVRRSVADHGEILDAALAKKTAQARRLLERNWRVGMGLILARLGG
jgi:DNA-binding GntR family transcriptional regulator